MTQANRLAIEGALERGHVWVAMHNGRYWRVRRNGATKLWKTMPEQFRIPIKAGLRSYTYINHASIVHTTHNHNVASAHFVISECNPTEVKVQYAVT